MLRNECASGTSAPQEFSEPGPNGEIRLIGRQCLDCGALFFPAHQRCVACFRRNLKPAELARDGQVQCFTIVRQAPSGYFGPVPYAIGNVLLSDGVSVLSPLCGKSVDDWQIGDAVAAYAIAAKASEGTPISFFGFKPAKPDGD